MGEEQVPRGQPILDQREIESGQRYSGWNDALDNQDPAPDAPPEYMEAYTDCKWHMEHNGLKRRPLMDLHMKTT